MAEYRDVDFHNILTYQDAVALWYNLFVVQPVAQQIRNKSK